MTINLEDSFAGRKFKNSHIQNKLSVLNIQLSSWSLNLCIKIKTQKLWSA